MDNLSEGRFHEVLPDVLEPTKVERLVFCTGKVYFDLEARRSENESEKVGIVRIEQLYPFPEEQVKALLSDYSSKVDIVWCQEEPENMGAWYFIRDRFAKFGRDVRVVSRKRSASPATGSGQKHNQEQEEILNRIWEGL